MFVGSVIWLFKGRGGVVEVGARGPGSKRSFCTTVITTLVRTPLAQIFLLNVDGFFPSSPVSYINKVKVALNTVNQSYIWCLPNHWNIYIFYSHKYNWKTKIRINIKHIKSINAKPGCDVEGIQSKYVWGFLSVWVGLLSLCHFLGFNSLF